jgi:hypothetical protein
MNPLERDSLHAAVFRNTAEDPAFIGYWLARHQQTENLDDQPLADKLGLAMDKLVMLCLCRTPRESSFRDDLTAICRYTGAPEELLAQILRREQVLLGWQKTAPPGQSGWLMAASDRPPNEEKSSEMPEDQDDT